MEAKVKELEEIKRYLLSEISLEKETHSQTLAQVESLKLQRNFLSNICFI